MAAPMKASMTAAESDVDDWFFDSVKLYDQLHMFDLQNPATAMCWMSSDRVCVVGNKIPGQSEIQELSLPSKLLASEADLVKDRDFDVMSGVYHDHTIASVHRVSNKCIVTSETRENLIQTWTLGDETTGTIRPSQTVKNPAPRKHAAHAAVARGSGDRVLFGDAVCRLCLADLETGKYLYQSADNCEDQICRLDFIDENTFLCCSQSSGDLRRVDIREDTSESKCHKWDGAMTDKSVGQWASDFFSGENGMTSIIVRTSDSGEMFVSDLRQPDTWIKKAEIKETQPKDLQIKVCPRDPNIISTVNYRGEVILYNTQDWTQSSPNVASEFFRHKGHWVNSAEQSTVIRAHMWHPTCQQLVLSAACDGSLHAWVAAK